MKILHVIAVMAAGGAETMVEVLADDAVAHGHEVVLASSGGFRADALAARGVRTAALSLVGRRPLDLLRSARALRRFVRHEQPDVVHVHNVKAALVARVATRGIPTAVTVHGLVADDYGPAARILRWTADHVVACAPHVGDLLEKGGLDAGRITLIENAMVPLAVHDRADARERLGLAADVPVVVCVARLDRPKRHDLLVEAWRSAPDDAVLLVVGDGPLRAEIEAQVAASGVADRIRLLGERGDVDWLLAASDLLVLPTDSEGLPISLLEAMSAGVPVVASRVGGIADNLGEVVHLVDPGSAPALAEGLRAVLADPSYRRVLAQCGKAFVAERSDPAVMLGRYRDLYARLVSGAGTRGKHG